MTAGAEPRPGGDDVAEVTYVVLTPSGELQEKKADGRPDPDDPDLEVPYQSALWTAVDSVLASEGVCGLAVPGQDMRAKMVDAEVARRCPALFLPNPYASAVLTILGLRLEKSVRGTVVIVHEEDADTGLTGSLSHKQLEAVRAAYLTVTAGTDAAARWRFH